ncbi:MAG: DUF4176 domain-containing protein [Blautia sp.]|nr:DUF4176 domain-containing protein [Lachnoclostridium sp.]MCM1212677.1 DUF4176 domain-containing protein [Blautia sp.]
MKEEREKTFLPIGSVVIARGNVKKLLIIARAVFVKTDSGEEYFDYGACTYPEGVLGKNMLYFNQEGVAEVIHKGYADEDEKRMLENIEKGLEKLERDKAVGMTDTTAGEA